MESTLEEVQCWKIQYFIRKNRNIKKLNIFVESLHVEICRIKILIHVDNSYKPCDVIYAEFTSLRDMHVPTFEQHK
jgi:hypothetical protein